MKKLLERADSKFVLSDKFQEWAVGRVGEVMSLEKRMMQITTESLDYDLFIQEYSRLQKRIEEIKAQVYERDLFRLMILELKQKLEEKDV